MQPKNTIFCGRVWVWGGMVFLGGPLPGQKLLPRRLSAAVPPYDAQTHAHSTIIVLDHIYHFFMSMEGSAKFVYEHRLVLVMRIEVSLILGEFMGIECASCRSADFIFFFPPDVTYSVGPKKGGIEWKKSTEFAGLSRISIWCQWWEWHCPLVGSLITPFISLTGRPEMSDNAVPLFLRSEKTAFCPNALPAQCSSCQMNFQILDKLAVQD